MTDKKIKDLHQGNKLVGEFMDLYLSEWNTIVSKANPNFCKPSWADLRYNESWDCLIPVVKKIYEVYSSYMSRDFSDSSGIEEYLIDEVFGELEDLCVVNNSIQEFFESSVKFIRTYNENK